MTVRPSDLPDFQSPPVSEVVLGAQFRTPTGYTQIRAGEVWNLFRSEYPKVEEHPPIAPAFETFGPSSRVVQIPFNLVTGATHDRFWFVSEAGTELIQFQSDKLLHNWRKMGVPENAYPRFENMIAKFENELRELDRYVDTLSPQRLEINQCEITYINLIRTREIKGSKPSSWLKGLELPTGGPEDFSYAFRRVITDDGGKPTGRLTCEIASGLDDDMEPVIRLAITVRGAPSGPTIDDTVSYLSEGRSLIVHAFAEITTEAAHRHWRRTT